MSRIYQRKWLWSVKMKNPLLLKNVFIKVHLNPRNMNDMSTRTIHCFLCRKVWEMYFNLGVMIIPCGDVKRKGMVEALNNTRLRLTYKVKMFSPWLQVYRFTFLVLNSVMDHSKRKLHFKGLFTRREGYPCGRVTLASGLKIARVYKQNFHSSSYPITRVNFASFTDMFRLAWPHKTVISILCNFQDLKENLEFSAENTINSRKYGKILSSYTGNTSFTDEFRHAWPYKTKIDILCRFQGLKEYLKFSVENTINSRKYGRILSSYTGNTVYCSDVYHLAPKLDNSVQIINITGHAWRRTRQVG